MANNRLFMLYHWSPTKNRKQINKYGLKIRMKDSTGMWRSPYVCFCRYPNTAWALSATHGQKGMSWDLWCTWSDSVGDYETLNTSKNPKKQWWMTEYRSFQRIPKSKIWMVGTRTHGRK